MAELSSGAVPSAAAADRLIAAHDGDVALLYIYIKRFGAYNAEDAAHTLCRTLGEIRAAEEKLRRMGLWLGVESAPAEPSLPLPASEPPEYTTEYVMRRLEEDEKLSTVLDEANRVFQRILSGPETRRFVSLYDAAGLPPEVMLELLHFCAENPGGRLTLGRIEKEARIWAEQEILTLEQAEAYIRRWKQRTEDTQRIQTALGIRDRSLSPTEKKCVEAWLDMGFGEDAIVLAYDRTVTKTGGYKLRYMDKILQSWHEKNLHTPQEIEQGDGRPAGTGGDVSRKQLEQLEELRNRLR